MLNEEDLNEVKCDKCGDSLVKFFMKDHKCKVLCPICNQEMTDHKSLNDHMVAHDMQDS